MPRARTQSGIATWADTVSVLATEIQAMPSTTIAGRPPRSPAPARSGWTARRAPGCRSARTGPTRSVPRQRGKNSAATMAPPPRQDSITVKVPAPPPCRPRATSGSSATAPVLCRKNRKMRSRITFRRGDCIAKLSPTRIAPTKRSPGSALVRGCVLPAQHQHEGPRRQHGVEHEHRRRAEGRQQGAGEHRADHARQVHRDAVERQRRRQLRAARRSAARWRQTPASASPGRCRC
jgi:hypothetical protein